MSLHGQCGEKWLQQQVTLSMYIWVCKYCIESVLHWLHFCNNDGQFLKTIKTKEAEPKIFCSTRFSFLSKPDAYITHDSTRLPTVSSFFSFHTLFQSSDRNVADSSDITSGHLSNSDQLLLKPQRPFSYSSFQICRVIPNTCKQALMCKIDRVLLNNLNLFFNL